VDREALTNWILERAQALGAVAAGVAAVTPMDPAPLATWLDAGYGAEMSFLRRHLPLRADLTAVLPEARSVVCVAMPYPPAGDDPVAGAVARYARGEDYHRVVTRLLDALWTALRAQAPGEGRVFVDSGPLPERELARRAGLGWIGRHGCLITPAGSRVVLGELLTTIDLAPTAPVAGDCGTCRRCLDACPTGALCAPGVVDARRCLSYLTIEHRGEIPAAVRAAVGTRLFGCDACQDACPHNPAPAALPYPADAVADLLSLDDDALRARFRGTSLLRAKPDGLRRNARIALDNLG
jgi:epoxyqueuosine reductase